MANFYATYSPAAASGATVTVNQGAPGATPWPVDVVGSLGPLTGGRASVALVRRDYTGGGAVNTTVYTQIVASTTASIGWLYIFDSSGSAMILAVGAPGSEVDQLYIGPGGNGFNLAIPAGSRISLKALDAAATTGEFVMTGLS